MVAYNKHEVNQLSQSPQQSYHICHDKCHSVTMTQLFCNLPFTSAQSQLIRNCATHQQSHTEKQDTSLTLWSEVQASCTHNAFSHVGL